MGNLVRHLIGNLVRHPIGSKTPIGKTHFWMKHLMSNAPRALVGYPGKNKYVPFCYNKLNSGKR